MFYELKHPLTADYFRVEVGVDFGYPAHLHHCFELLCVTEGEMHTEVDDIKYKLKAGKALMIFPNQIHSMRTPNHSRHVLCLFSPELVSAYTEKTSSLIPVDNLFGPDGYYIDILPGFASGHSMIEMKGLLYSLCGSFDAQTSYREADSTSNVLLFNIFKFIEQNYNSDCTLNALAKNTGYEYTYLSRNFKQTVGISYNDYVNQYRISKACYLLQNSDSTILEISEECGFNSLRSFNRNFKAQLAIPPAEYRNNIRSKNNLQNPALTVNHADNVKKPTLCI